MAAVDSSTVYRDATYSARTQELLRRLLGRLTSTDGWLEGKRGEEILALTDVVNRWDANDATETVFVEHGATSPLLAIDPVFRDSYMVVYKAACPTCARPLEWAIETPPIPRTLYSWFDPNGEGRRLDTCPGCGEELPEGDLTPLDPIIVMRAGFCYASVCAAEDVDRDDIERQTNGWHPTGISSRWSIADETFADGQPNPCPCPDHEGRLHYLLVC